MELMLLVSVLFAAVTAVGRPFVELAGAALHCQPIAAAGVMAKLLQLLVWASEEGPHDAFCCR